MTLQVSMRFFKALALIGMVFAFMLTVAGCGGGEGQGGAKGPGGKGGKGGIADRSIKITGYVAEVKTYSTEFKTTGELKAEESVELKTETSGKLVKLNVKDGAKVQRGALLAKLDDSELRASKKQAEATLTLATQTKERTEKLREQGSATEVEMEAANSSYESAKASVELLDAQIAKTEIRAPFSGVIGFLNVTLGEWLSSGATVVTLSDVSKLRVRFMLPQRYATGVNVGGKVEIKDSERGMTGEAKIRTMNAVLSTSSRSREVEAVINNKDGSWLAGSFVSMVVPLDAEARKSVTIPAEALTLDDNGGYVYVVRSGKAFKTYVQTSLRTPISVTIASGITEGDTVAVSGIISLHDGASVELRGIRNREDYEVTE